MRVLLSISIVLLLAQSATANEHWPRFGDVVTATAGGLLRASENGTPRDPVPFGSGFQDVMHMMAGVFGQNVHIEFPAECGAGPMVWAYLPDRITLMFQEDIFVAWFMGDSDQLVTDTGL